MWYEESSSARNGMEESSGFREGVGKFSGPADARAGGHAAETRRRLAGFERMPKGSGAGGRHGVAFNVQTMVNSIGTGHFGSSRGLGGEKRAWAASPSTVSQPVGPTGTRSPEGSLDSSQSRGGGGSGTDGMDAWHAVGEAPPDLIAVRRRREDSDDECDEGTTGGFGRPGNSGAGCSRWGAFGARRKLGEGGFVDDRLTAGEAADRNRELDHAALFMDELEVRQATRPNRTWCVLLWNDRIMHGGVVMCVVVDAYSRCVLHMAPYSARERAVLVKENAYAAARAAVSEKSAAFPALSTQPVGTSERCPPGMERFWSFLEASVGTPVASGVARPLNLDENTLQRVQHQWNNEATAHSSGQVGKAPVLAFLGTGMRSKDTGLGMCGLPRMPDSIRRKFFGEEPAADDVPDFDSGEFDGEDMG